MNDKDRESEAMVSLLKDVIEYKRREAKFLFTALVVCLVLNFLQMGAFLLYESQFEYGDATVTTTEQTERRVLVPGRGQGLHPGQTDFVRSYRDVHVHEHGL